MFEESNAWADIISAAIASTGVVSQETADLIVQVGEKVLLSRLILQGSGTNLVETH